MTISHMKHSPLTARGHHPSAIYIIRRPGEIPVQSLPTPTLMRPLMNVNQLTLMGDVAMGVSGRSVGSPGTPALKPGAI